MLTGILIFFHVIACFTLILVILLQVGRGHGLSGASFNQGGVQTVFGTKAADFFSKATSVMAVIFVLTCISLDVVYARKSKSLFGSAQPGAQKVDMEKLKQVLDKIKAEQAAKQQPGSTSEVSPEGAVKQASTDANAVLQESATAASQAVSTEMPLPVEPPVMPEAVAPAAAAPSTEQPASSAKSEPSEQTPASPAQGG